ncbi:MAG TPA: phenylacetate--CoA ligase, partial [Dissulfurispiraceae bacterium]|nr:phenylacetate--CoA ligase [Dissulfurispiraceae bacterium]
MIWNKQAECMPDKERKNLQLERLRDTVRRAYENVPYYRKRFDELKLKPSDISSLKDICKLPFTGKADLREGYPFGMFAVPQKEIVEVHTSSGTTGKPVVAGYTRKDIDTWG